MLALLIPPPKAPKGDPRLSRQTFTPSPRVGFKHKHLIPEPKFLSTYVLSHQVCGLKRKKEKRLWAKTQLGL